MIATYVENRSLIRHEPIEFEKKPVEVQDFTNITDYFRWIDEMYPKLIKNNRKLTTCNTSQTLETLGFWSIMPKIKIFEALRATSHMRLRALDHYTPSTLIGGKAGVGLGLLHTTLERPRSMWMQDGSKVYMNSYMAPNGSCFIVYMDYFWKPSLGGRPNTKPGDHGNPNSHNYRNTIVGSSPGIWIFIYFEKTRFASPLKKLNFSIFVF